MVVGLFEQFAVDSEEYQCKAFWRSWRKSATTRPWEELYQPLGKTVNHGGPAKRFIRKSSLNLCQLIIYFILMCKKNDKLKHLAQAGARCCRGAFVLLCRLGEEQDNDRDEG